MRKLIKQWIFDKLFPAYANAWQEAYLRGHDEGFQKGFMHGEMSVKRIKSRDFLLCLNSAKPRGEM